MRRTRPQQIDPTRPGVPTPLAHAVNAWWANPGALEQLPDADRAAFTAARDAARSVNVATHTEHQHGWSAWLSDHDTTRIAVAVVATARTHPAALRTPAALFESVWRLLAHVHAQGLIVSTATRTQVATVAEAAAHAAHPLLTTRP